MQLIGFCLITSFEGNKITINVHRIILKSVEDLFEWLCKMSWKKYSYYWLNMCWVNILQSYRKPLINYVTQNEVLINIF